MLLCAEYLLPNLTEKCMHTPIIQYIEYVSEDFVWMFLRYQILVSKHYSITRD